MQEDEQFEMHSNTVIEQVFKQATHGAMLNVLLECTDQERDTLVRACCNVLWGPSVTEILMQSGTEIVDEPDACNGSSPQVALLSYNLKLGRSKHHGRFTLLSPSRVSLMISSIT